MPIEFPCTQCGRLLRTPDETAGKQARCPECGGIVPIPAASTVSPRSASSPGATGGQAAGADVLPPIPFGTDLRAYAASRLTGPAVSLLMLSGFTVLAQLLVMVGGLFGMGFWGIAAKRQELPAVLAVGSAMLVLHALAAVVHCGVVVGAVAMLRQRSHALATAGAVLAILPVSCVTGVGAAVCCLPLWLIETGVGIWALATLADPLVKTAFATRT